MCSSFNGEKAVSSRTSRNEIGSGVTLEFRDVSQVFLRGESVVAALANVSFTVQSGEFVAIVGPSGCGKTTLLGMVARMLQPSAGSVLIDGELAKESNARVAYMLARDALLPWRTAVQNVELALQVGGFSSTNRRARALEWLGRMGLVAEADVNVRRLSHGMRQRVAIARTLAQNPRCVLMDEPFAALDAQTRLVVQREFLTLWENQRPTVLFVTHDLGEALLMADRVLLMSSRPGRILQDLRVPLPRPRNPENDRSNSVFLDMQAQLWSQLRVEFESAKALDDEGE